LEEVDLGVVPLALPTPPPPVGVITLVVLGVLVVLGAFGAAGAATVKVAEAAVARWSPPLEVASVETVATTFADAGSLALGVRPGRCRLRSRFFGPVTGLPLAVIENRGSCARLVHLGRESNRNDLRRIHAGRASRGPKRTTEGTTWVDAVSGVIVANGGAGGIVHDSGAEARDIGGLPAGAAHRV